eukprot:4927192-Pleurochrysis_carterae.AAC.1
MQNLSWGNGHQRFLGTMQSTMRNIPQPYTPSTVAKSEGGLHRPSDLQHTFAGTSLAFNPSMRLGSSGSSATTD